MVDLPTRHHHPAAAALPADPPPRPPAPDGGGTGGGFMLDEFAAICAMTGADPEETALEFRRGWHQEALESAAKQARIAEATHRLERSWLEGLGQLEMSIDPRVYHGHGIERGYECWTDNDFIDSMHRHEPSTRVPQAGAHTVITVARKLKPMAAGPPLRGALRSTHRPAPGDAGLN